MFTKLSSHFYEIFKRVTSKVLMGTCVHVVKMINLLVYMHKEAHITGSYTS